ncbi:MAG: hypothetical protein LM586_04940 [Desulfurococcales archaeon]|nr:hypothetical protein [Desulfurococcales archaeon]
MARYFLGIDSGATKIEVSLINDEIGLIETTSLNKSGNPAVVSLDRFCENISEAIRIIISKSDISKIHGIGIGLAGYLEGRWNNDIKKCLYERLNIDPETVIIFEDIYAAHVSTHLLGDGVIGILGTGSNFYGRCKGSFWRVGGWGHYIDDRGGAYSFGARGLSIVVRSLDGRIGYTKLVEYALDFYKADDVHKLVSKIYSSEDPKSMIASFAPYVFKAFREKDLYATKIVEEEVSEIILAISTVYRRLGCLDIPLGIIGSLYRENKNVLKKMIEEGLERELGVKIEIQDPKIRQSCASALIMLKEKGFLDKELFDKIVRRCS